MCRLDLYGFLERDEGFEWFLEAALDLAEFLKTLELNFRIFRDAEDRLEARNGELILLTLHESLRQLAVGIDVSRIGLDEIVKGFDRGLCREPMGDLDGFAVEQNTRFRVSRGARLFDQVVVERFIVVDFSK